MKRIVLNLVVASLTGWAGLVWAQDATPVPVLAPIAKTGALLGSHSSDAIRARMKEQNRRINADLKSGKLSQEDARVLSEKVKMVGQQMSLNYQQSRLNNRKGLAGEQVQELNRMLDENSMAIRNQVRGAGIGTPVSAIPVPTAFVRPTAVPETFVAPVAVTVPAAPNVVEKSAPVSGGAPQPGSAPQPANAPAPGKAPNP